MYPEYIKSCYKSIIKRQTTQFLNVWKTWTNPADNTEAHLLLRSEEQPSKSLCSDSDSPLPLDKLRPLVTLHLFSEPQKVLMPQSMIVSLAGMSPLPFYIAYSFCPSKHHYHVTSFMKVSLISLQATNVPSSKFPKYLLPTSCTCRLCGRHSTGNSMSVTLFQPSICLITMFTFQTFVPHSRGLRAGTISYLSL